MNKQEDIKTLLLPILQEQETKRVAIHKRVRATKVNRVAIYPIAVVCFFVTLVLLYHLMDYMPELIRDIFGLLCVGVLVLYVYGVNHWRDKWDKEQEQLQGGFEQEVRKVLGQAVFGQWSSILITEHSPDKVVAREEFETADLHHGYTRYKGSNYCEGQLEDGRTFRFSEVLVQRYQSYDGDSGHLIPVFKGLFFVLENTLPFEGFSESLDVQIVPRLKNKNSQEDAEEKPPTTSKTPKKYNESILDADLDLFIKEDSAAKEPLPPLFDRLFEVRGTRAEATRAQMPPEFCEQLNQLRLILGQQLAFSFDNNKLYFTIRQQGDFLTAPLEYSALSEGRVNTYVNNFKLVARLLNYLENNTVKHP